MKLAMLAKTIATELKAKPWAEHFNPVSTERMMCIVDFVGPSNEHLANPLNKDPNVYYFRPRPVPLTGDEEISGEYLMFDYCSHYESMKLREFESLSELEKIILDGAGITNNFTSDMVAIVHGTVKRYTVTFFGAKTGSRQVFDKTIQYTGPEPFRDHEQLQLHWLD